MKLESWMAWDTRLAMGRRILVLEDEYFIADDLQSALVHRGMEVLGPVPTCREALDIIGREHRIDGAVLDINLAGELCFPVADALTERGVPFVFVTGYEEEIVPGRFRHVPRWEKPFNISELVSNLPGALSLS